MKLFWRSPALRTAGVYGAAGASFAVANLVLARVLPEHESALVTLIVALVNVGYALAPLGLDGVVNRRSLEAGPRLLRQTLLAACLTATAFALGALVYETSTLLTALIFLSTAAGGVLTVAAAQFQSERRFGASLALGQSPNLVLLIAALVTLAVSGREATLPLLIMAAGWFHLGTWPPSACSARSRAHCSACSSWASATPWSRGSGRRVSWRHGAGWWRVRPGWWPSW